VKDSTIQYEVHFTVSAVLYLFAYEDKNHEKYHPFDSTGEEMQSTKINTSIMLHRIRIKTLREEVIEWMRATEEKINNRLMSSDLYFDVDRIEKLNVYMKVVPVRIGGSVNLVNPELFSKHIYNPITNSDCFFMCLEKFFEMNPEFHYSNIPNTAKNIVEQRNLVKRAYNEQFKTKNNTFAIDQRVSLKENVSNILINFVEPPLRAYVHKERKDNSNEFEIIKKKCSKLPPESAADQRSEIHLGIVASHFFLILDTEILTTRVENTLKTTSFVIVDEDEEEEQLNVNTPIQVVEFIKGGVSTTRTLYEMNIPERKLENQITRMKKEDKFWDGPDSVRSSYFNKSNEKMIAEYYATTDFLREMITKNRNCANCGKTILSNNWRFYTIDNNRGYIKSNIKLCCYSCIYETVDKAIIEDWEIRNRITEYIDQDLDKGRDIKSEPYIDIASIRKMFEKPICNLKCKKPVTEENWSIDRISNEKPHFISNCQLTCRNCNKKRGRKTIEQYANYLEESEVYIWDMEALRNYLLEHIPYNIGALKYEHQGDRTEKEYGEYLKNATTILYGEDAMDRFYEYVMSINDRLKKKVEMMVDSVMSDKRYEKKTPEKREKSRKKLYEEYARKNKALFYAHNSANYDSQFIFKYHKFKFEHIIEAHGLLALTLQGGLIEFRDSMRMFGPVSLANLCMNYQIDPSLSKTSFPHNFAAKDTLNYIGEVPKADMWPNHKIPKEHRNKPFDFKAVSCEYQVMDCVSLCMLWDKFSTIMINAMGMKPSDYLTIPSLALIVIYKMTHQGDIMIVKNKPIDKFFRISIQGGRCMPQKGYFKSVDADNIYKLWDSFKEELSEMNRLALDLYENNEDHPIMKKLFEVNKFNKERRQMDLIDLCVKVSDQKVDDENITYSIDEFKTQCDKIRKLWEHVQEHSMKLKDVVSKCKDYITDLDATSLYPSAMYKFAFPVGIPYWEINNINSIMDQINNKDADMKLCIVECDVEFPNRAGCVCPLNAVKSKEGSLFYNFEPKQHLVRTNIDLIEAVKYNGAVITAIHRAMVWPEKKKIFEKAMETLFQNRLDAKKANNIALSNTIKLTTNSGYGKMYEKNYESDLKIFGEDKVDEVDELYRKGKVMLDEDLGNEEQCLLKLRKDKKHVRINTPTYLGSFILAFSKVIMNNAIAAFDGFYNWDHTFYYTDTDSLHVHHDQIEVLKAIDSINESDKKILGGAMGQLKDDISEVKNGKIIEAIFVSPKVYKDLIVGEAIDSVGRGLGYYTLIEHTRAKGVPKKGQKSLSMQVFREMLFDRKEYKVDKVDPRYKKDYKHANAPAIVDVPQVKIINQTIWGNRMPYDLITNRYIPYGYLEKE
jgi:hypothetical protein